MGRLAVRLVPAATFFAGVFIGFMPRGFSKLGAGDAAFGALIWLLLARVRRDG
jgi:hypothetical protein